MNKQSGQTLIEVVAAVSITSLVLGGLVVVVLNGLKNAKFAQDQALATKYAQDTMEEIRAVRDRSNPVTGTGYNFGCYLSDCSFLNPPQIPSCLHPVGGGGPACYFSLDDASLTLTDEPKNTPPQSLGNGFSRSIELVNSPPPSVGSAAPNEKTIIVIISWVDVSGTHQSFLQTNLSQQ